jgi:small subunit ribosomal protein S2
MPALSISARDLLASGVHYGHRVSKWNPKMRPYIHAKKNLIHIIDVRETIKGLVKGWHFLEKLAARGELILFVGTKRQAGGVIKAEAARAGMPYVSERWLGGTLTNYDTIRNRLNRLKEIEQWELDGTIKRYSKKEQSSINREKRKLLRNLDGLRTMDRLPACLVLVDPQHEAIAVQEAAKIGAATVALIDSDGDPDKIDIAIPGNDDSLTTVNININKLADAVIAGKTRLHGSRRPRTSRRPARSPSPCPKSRAPSTWGRVAGPGAPRCPVTGGDSAAAWEAAWAVARVRSPRPRLPPPRPPPPQEPDQPWPTSTRSSSTISAWRPAPG